MNPEWPRVWRFRGAVGEFAVARPFGHDLPADPFFNAADLHFALDRSLAGPFGPASVHEILHRIDVTLIPGGGQLLHYESPHIVRERLLEAFRREAVVVLEQPREASSSGWDATGEPPPPAGPTTAAAAAPAPVTTWVEIQLLTEAGKPCVGEPFRVELPDGSVWEGKLEAGGKARKDGIPEGQCKIRFPELGPETGKS